MKKIAITVLLASSSLALYGCGGDDVTNNPGDAGNDGTTKTDTGTKQDTGVPDTFVADTGTTDTGTTDGGDGGIPAPPALKTQVDRFGRPAINTALNHVFDAACTKMTCAPKDTYNADSNPANWATYTTEFAKNLAIFDGVDMMCGNQILAGMTATAGRYDTLAGALTGDAQWLNTGSTTCTTYLAVEANATGLLANTDCGGRALPYDVIDETYSAVSIGALTGVTDGVSADPVKTGGTTFPYLSAAQ